jgi:tetratricopeptide (TPR) repeat protein
MKEQTTSQSQADQARILYGAGDFSAAASLYGSVAVAYREAGDDLNAAEMLNNQSVSLLRSGQPQAALEAALGTEKIFDQAGDFRRLGMAYANQASALESLKRFKEAIPAYENAGEALEKAGEDQLRVQVMQLLSALYLRRWKFYNAVIALQSGLAGVKDPTPRQRLMKKLIFFRL